MDNIEKKVISLRKKGFTRNEISKILGIGHQKTQRILEKYGLTGRQGVDFRKRENKKKIKIKNKKEYVEKERKKVISQKQKQKVKKTQRQKKKVINKSKKKKQKGEILKTAYYGFINGKIQIGLFVEPVEVGTIWCLNVEDAYELILMDCEELKKKYKFYLTYASIVSVRYKVINGKVEIKERKTFMDITDDIDYCLKI
jgi:hypothetical protein